MAQPNQKQCTTDIDNARLKEAKNSCHSTPPEFRLQKEQLMYPICMLRDGAILDVIDRRMQHLGLKARACLAVYGAVKGLSSASS